MSIYKRKSPIYEYGPVGILKDNLRQRLEYGLIQLGAYTAVCFDLPTSGSTILKPVSDPRYPTNTVWEGLGPSWIWQTGVNGPSGDLYDDIFPVSGVWVDGTFYDSSTTGPFEHTIDYRNGQVRFSNAVTGTIQCEYVFNDVQVQLTDSPQWPLIIQSYIDGFDNISMNFPSGIAAIIKEKRVWLPAVFIEQRTRNEKTGLQLGSMGEIQDSEIAFHIFAEQDMVRDNIASMLDDESGKTINLFNSNLSPTIFNDDGSIASGALEYPELASRQAPYFWTYSRVSSSRLANSRDLPGLYRAEVDQTITIYRYGSTY